MLGRLFGTNAKTAEIDEDEAIIHQSVPDEVLYPEGRPGAVQKDMSWLEAAPVRNTPKPVVQQVSPRPQSPVPTPVPEPVGPPAVQPSPTRIATANPQVNAERPPFPYGFLIVVEGGKTGDWHPLYRGRTDIGDAPGQTIQLANEDSKLGSASQVVLTYDEIRHAFVLEGDDTARLNGRVLSGPEVLRDGDVFTLCGASLRLVALCSQNFNWSEHIAD